MVRTELKCTCIRDPYRCERHPIDAPGNRDAFDLEQERKASDWGRIPRKQWAALESEEEWNERREMDCE